MPRFVVLEHDYPHQHWDLMLEAGSVLRTWRLALPLGPGQAIAAEPVFDHRLTYLDYEGPISGGRGSVRRREGGTFTWLTDELRRVRVHLHGERLEGILELSQHESGPWHAWFAAQAAPG